jgi:hypothetical protein
LAFTRPRRARSGALQRDLDGNHSERCLAAEAPAETSAIDMEAPDGMEAAIAPPRRSQPAPEGSAPVVSSEGRASTIGLDG